MTKTLFALAAVLALATPVLANGQCTGLPFTDGKLQTVVTLDPPGAICTVEIKASTDLPNACAGLDLSVGVDNAVSLDSLLLEVGVSGEDGVGFCGVSLEPDESGNGAAKAECANTGHVKMNVTLSSCVLTSQD